MKNIVIITYCTSSNSGTFLQAYAVNCIYKAMFPNCNIKYIKAHRIGNIKRKNENNLTRLQLFYTKAISYVRKHYYLHLSKKYFPAYSPMPLCFKYDNKILNDVYNNNDLVSIGSDTILERFSYDGQIGLMWGMNSSKAKKVILAGSADNCGLLYKDNKIEEIKQRIDNFDFIGIRDNILYDFLINHVGIDDSRINLQPDPTYYLPLSTFNVGKILHKRLTNINNLVMFHFDRNFKYRQKLAILIKSMGYTLMSPEYDPCCDISLGIISPFQWGDLFKYCNVIFTERFHDTVFSLRHCIPVINVDWNKDNIANNGDSKRTEILKLYGLEKYHLSIYDENDISADLIITIKKLLFDFDKNRINKINDSLIESLTQSIETLKSNIISRKQ